MTKFIDFIRKTLQHRCFSVKYAKMLIILILKNTCRRLLLYRHVFYLICSSSYYHIKPTPKSTFQFSISLVSMEKASMGLLTINKEIFKQEVIFCSDWYGSELKFFLFCIFSYLHSTEKRTSLASVKESVENCRFVLIY